MTDAELPRIVSEREADVVIPEDVFDTAREALAGVDVTVSPGRVGLLRSTHVTLDRISPPTFERVRSLLKPITGVGVIAFSMGRTATVGKLTDIYRDTSAVIGHDPIGSIDRAPNDLTGEFAAAAPTIAAVESEFVSSVMSADALPVVVVGSEADVTVPAAMLEAARTALVGLGITVGVLDDVPAAAIHLERTSIHFDGLNAVVEALAAMPEPLHVVMTAPEAFADVLHVMAEITGRGRRGLFGDELMPLHNRLFDQEMIGSAYRATIGLEMERFERVAVDLPDNGFDYRRLNEAPRSQRRSRGGRGGRGGRR